MAAIVPGLPSHNRGAFASKTTSGCTTTSKKTVGTGQSESGEYNVAEYVTVCTEPVLFII